MAASREAERRDRQAETLRDKLARIESAQKGLMTQTEQLGVDTSPAANAYRDRIREQFTERYNEHTAVKAELDALTTTAPAVNDPALLDELPYAPGLLADARGRFRQTPRHGQDRQRDQHDEQAGNRRQPVASITRWATSGASPPNAAVASV